MSGEIALGGCATGGVVGAFVQLAGRALEVSDGLRGGEFLAHVAFSGIHGLHGEAGVSGVADLTGAGVTQDDRALGRVDGGETVAAAAVASVGTEWEVTKY